MKKANNAAIDIIKKMRDKAFAINLLTLFSRGYVEFRPIGGAGYEKDIKHVFDHISRFVQLIQIASDPDMYRKEYMSKLGKMMAGGPKAPAQTIDVKIIERWLSSLRLSQRDRDKIILDNKIVVKPSDLMSYVGYCELEGKPIPDTALKIMIRVSGLDKEYVQHDVRLPWTMSERTYELARKRLDPILAR